MKRSNPFFSIIGLASFVLLLVIVAISFLQNGGLIFSPGHITSLSQPGVLLGGFASHAAFASHCDLCHQPFKTIQAVLCMNCHKDVKNEIDLQTGIHGHLLKSQRCMDCHSEHKGQNFNPSQAALTFFDHSTTPFDLIHHQVGYDDAPMSCSACHTQVGQTYVFQLVSCTQCHAQKDEPFMKKHLADFGPACLDCHDGKDRMKNFDHAKTTFPLQGKHETVACAACHIPIPTGSQFKGLSQECKDCHKEPDSHRGVFAFTCADCHDPTAWTPARLNGASFDHMVQTGFSLTLHQKDFSAGALTCNTCHVKDLKTMDTQTCVDCHRQPDASFMDKHVATYGLACMSCHDGVDKMHNFDHNQFFVLDGKHAQIQCADCHGAAPQTVRYAGTPKDCVTCHAEPKIHAGVFGLACQDCHTTTAWQPAYLRNHTFPLDHGGSPVACEVCHTKTYQEYTCYGCHAHQPDETVVQHDKLNISADDFPKCAKCHPTGLKGN